MFDNIFPVSLVNPKMVFPSNKKISQDLPVSIMLRKNNFLSNS